MTSDREYVLSIHRDAFAATRDTRHYIARPGETVPRRISALTDTEAAAWTDAADRMKRARESWPLGAGLEAPPEEPTVHIALQYVGVRHRGMSFAIGDTREHVTYALPFIFPIGGTTQTVPVPERVIPSGEMPAAVMIDGDAAAVVPHEPEPPACGYPSDDERHVEGPSFLHDFVNADGSSVTGRYWTAAQLASGCGTVTTMAQAIAETYARDPGFYGGTFCVGCGTHLPVGEAGEFVWVDDGTRVGT